MARSGQYFLRKCGDLHSDPQNIQKMFSGDMETGGSPGLAQQSTQRNNSKFRILETLPQGHKAENPRGRQLSPSLPSVVANTGTLCLDTHTPSVHHVHTTSHVFSSYHFLFLEEYHLNGSVQQITFQASSICLCFVLMFGAGGGAHSPGRLDKSCTSKPYPQLQDGHVC